MTISASYYADRSAIQVLRLIHDIGKLKKVDAASAYCLLGMVEFLVGNHEAGEHEFAKAWPLNPDARLYSNLWCCLANAGFASKANALVPSVFHPSRNLDGFLEIGRTAITSGSIIAVCNHLDVVESMKIDLSGFPVDVFRKAKALMGELCLSDENVADFLDVAGQVLRDRKMFFLGPTSRLVVIDTPDYPERGLYFSFDIPVSHDEAANIYFELAERLCQKYDALPVGLHVAFRGVSEVVQ